MAFQALFLMTSFNFTSATGKQTSPLSYHFTPSPSYPLPREVIFFCWQLPFLADIYAILKHRNLNKVCCHQLNSCHSLF